MRKGSVTVFFSLVFLLLFSFVLSFFEMAAYTARTTYHLAAAHLAVENCMAGFHRELYSEYRIFGRELEGKETGRIAVMERIAPDVEQMTVKKRGQLSLLLRGGADFSVIRTSLLTDNRAEGFYLQAVQAMKYQSVNEALEGLKKFLGLSKETKVQTELIQAEAETAEAYTIMEEKLLRLIETVDGVRISLYEQALLGQATAFMSDRYVKCFCNDPAGAVSSFERSEVYSAFLETYQNPNAILSLSAKTLKELAEIMEGLETKEEECKQIQTEQEERRHVQEESIRRLKEEIKELEEKGESLFAEAEKMEQSPNPTDEEKAKLVLLYEEVLQITNQKAKKEEELANAGLWKAQAEEALSQSRLSADAAALEKNEIVWQVADILQQECELSRVCTDVSQKCEYASYLLEEIEKDKELAQIRKDVCLSEIEAAETIIGKEAADSFRKDLKWLDVYESADGYDFERMRNTLKNNAEILLMIKPLGSVRDSQGIYRAAEQMRVWSEAFLDYSFDGLRLSYGNLSLENSVKVQVKDSLQSLLSSGFLGLIVPGEVSEKELDTSLLPSEFRYEGKDAAGISALLGSSLSSAANLLDGMLPEEEVGGQLASMSDPIWFHAYLMTFFSDYSKQKKDGALSYELEYLIAGKDSDTKNLSSVMTRICLLRTTLHLISLYTDQARKESAAAAAWAACGVIGMPALEKVIEFTLLLVWAVEESLVDCEALLLGKRVNLMPGKNGGSIAFSEMLLVGKDFLKKKAEDKASASLGLGYREFIQLFLWLSPKEEKCFRALDLIQENLRCLGDNTFLVNRCIWQIVYRVDGREAEFTYLD